MIATITIKANAHIALLPVLSLSAISFSSNDFVCKWSGYPGLARVLAKPVP